MRHAAASILILAATACSGGQAKQAEAQRTASAPLTPAAATQAPVDPAVRQAATNMALTAALRQKTGRGGELTDAQRALVAQGTGAGIEREETDAERRQDIARTARERFKARQGQSAK